MGKLSHNLIDLGFFSVLGTSEHPGFCKEEVYVVRGEPRTFDTNNGVVVIYDEDGRPWVMAAKNVVGVVSHGVQKLIVEFNIKRGAYVPHSNDSGHFVREVIPTL